MDCLTVQYIKELNGIIHTQNKILRDHLNPTIEEWKITSDQGALRSNTNALEKAFVKWEKDESTCHECKASIKANRDYLIIFENFKSLVNGDKRKINAELLMNTIKGV